MEYRKIDLSHKFLEPLEYIDAKPECLYMYGELPKRNRPVVSIVGSRRCTNYGEEIAYRIAYDLAKHGVVIVSGMALGIDAAAHRGCL